MTCQCGCGKPAARDFLPGHDQKLRIHLERKVGGLLNLRNLIAVTESLAAGEIASPDFRNRIKAMFTN